VWLEGEPALPQEQPSPVQVREALEELLGWPGISRSPQLSELLRYVVEKTLDGDEATIKAYSIAVDVFGRPPSFDPQADPIVRVQARRLRTLLEQFYDRGESKSDVQIRLPLGRYVPEFVAAGTPGGSAGSAGETAAPAAFARLTGPPWLLRNRFALATLLGFCFMVIGVALVVFLLRWAFPPVATATTMGVPDFPSITVGAFDNLTGHPTLDDDVSAVGQELSGALGKFELLRVVPNGGRFTVRASVQQDRGQFSLKALISENGTNGIVWSGLIAGPAQGGPDSQVLAEMAAALAAQLGAASGPLHAADRAWFARQATLPDTPTPYVCALAYMAWRDVRKTDDAATALDCLKRVLAASPDDGVALAEHAGLSAWLRGHDAPPGTDFIPLLADEVTEAGRAVSLMPDSSFAYEQQGLVLARQGLIDAALGALRKSIDLNPASMDALAAYGLLEWLGGNFERGSAAGEQAIAAVPSPPPFYYITRAFDALRQRRFYDAIDAAQALAAGDQELGPVIAVAAAPVIGRNDLIDRYRPMILSNPQFQAAGVMTRLRQLYRVPALLDRIREGLILAGIPPAALDGPFNADGTPRT
jgi:tetratricopeptide (TPR) repeat protein